MLTLHILVTPKRVCWQNSEDPAASGYTLSPFDTPICPIHQPRNAEYNEVFLFLCTLEMLYN